jgi:hypothetical protein
MAYRIREGSQGNAGGLSIMTDVLVALREGT